MPSGRGGNRYGLKKVAALPGWWIGGFASSSGRKTQPRSHGPLSTFRKRRRHEKSCHFPARELSSPEAALLNFGQHQESWPLGWSYTENTWFANFQFRQIWQIWLAKNAKRKLCVSEVGIPYMKSVFSSPNKISRTWLGQTPYLTWA